MTPGSSVQNCRLTSILRRGLAVRLWLENSSDAATKRDGSWRTVRSCSWPEPAAAAESPAAVTLAKVSNIAAARNAFQSCCLYASRQGANCCTKTSLHDPMIPPASGSREHFSANPGGAILYQGAEAGIVTLFRWDLLAEAKRVDHLGPFVRFRNVQLCEFLRAHWHRQEALRVEGLPGLGRGQRLLKRLRELVNDCRRRSLGCDQAEPERHVEVGQA